MKVKIFLMYTTAMAALCVGCRSSRTGFLQTSAAVQTRNAEHAERQTDLSVRQDISHLRSDSLSMTIIRYYPPPPGDTTAIAGPIRSATTIRYGSSVLSDTTATVILRATEAETTLADTALSLRQESKTVSKTVPWYSTWPAILASVIALAIITYFIIRRIRSP